MNFCYGINHSPLAKAALYYLGGVGCEYSNIGRLPFYIFTVLRYR